MNESGERMIASAKEALAIAKGEIAATSITVNGHTYYSIDRVLESFSRGREAGIRLSAEVGDKAQRRGDSVERAILSYIEKVQDIERTKHET